MYYASCIMHHKSCIIRLNQGTLSLVRCLQLKDLCKDSKFDIHAVKFLCIMHHASCIMFIAWIVVNYCCGMSKDIRFVQI